MIWTGVGALVCALAVIAGAFGAHGLKPRLDPAALELWETAAKYFMYSGLGLVAMGIVARLIGRPLTGPALSLLVGALIFSGTVALLALGGPRWLGAVTPLGGLAMIVGLLWLAWAAFRA